MRNKNILGAISGTVVVLAVIIMSMGVASAGTKPHVIYSFAGDDDGEYTDTDLVLDSAGNIYGASVQGGLHGSGTVFQVTPAGVHTVLYSFTGGADGGEPYKGVTLDAHGNLYGTAVTGGGGSCEGGCGVVYEVRNSGGVWSQKPIHTFTGGNDGSGPGAGLTFDANGYLYGTTPTGGANGAGVVFQMRPQANGSWDFRVIHTFTGGADGQGGSAGRLIFDAAGNLYGTCTVGGANGTGVVYAMHSSNGNWQFKTLYTFQGPSNGALPYGGLIFDKLGNLYGTTYYAGANDAGTVYKLSLKNGTWTQTVIYNFKGGSDGANPISTLVADAKGNLYGTTSEGGAASCLCGTVFRLSRGSSGQWTETVVYRFPGTPGAGFAYNGLASDGAGNLFGATVHGGPTNDGTIYSFTP